MKVWRITDHMPHPFYLGTRTELIVNGTDNVSRTMHLSLAANPSHLEAVYPVVIGKTKAKQFFINDYERYCDHLYGLVLLCFSSLYFALLFVLCFVVHCFVLLPFVLLYFNLICFALYGRQILFFIHFISSL